MEEIGVGCGGEVAISEGVEPVENEVAQRHYESCDASEAVEVGGWMDFS